MKEHSNVMCSVLFWSFLCFWVLTFPWQSNIALLQLNSSATSCKPAGHVMTAISFSTQRKWSLSVRPSLIQPPPPLSSPSEGVSDYVFCQCVCGNLLICTNTDSNAPATAAFLADGWLGCRLMAESAGPQLGAGNIAHYTFSRGVV